MRGTIVRIGVTGAGALLALGLLAAPPAGADESGKQGKSKRSEPTSCFDASDKTQGRSQSDPDGLENGGPDKPGCDGGIDDDRDGNNGCGNDADREDDNNGNCGRQSDVNEPDGYDARDDDAPAPSSTTTTTTAPEPIEVSPIVEEDSDEPDDATDTVSDDDSDTVSDDASDTVSDDTSDTTDDSDADSETEAPASSDDTSDEEPAPLATAGVGFGGLALLGGLVRLFLRIG